MGHESHQGLQSDDWGYIIDPHVSQSERDSLEGDNEEDEEPIDVNQLGQEKMPEELSAFLTVAFKGPLSPDRRRKLLDSYPRPTSTALSPPGLDKSMMPLIQKKKSVIARDRFLSN
jgi:hypothetical protein